MESLVVKEVSALSEGFPTLAAPVRLLSAVHPLVLDEAGLRRENLPALFATEGFLLCVDSLV